MTPPEVAGVIWRTDDRDARYRALLALLFRPAAPGGRR